MFEIQIAMWRGTTQLVVLAWYVTAASSVHIYHIDNELPHIDNNMAEDFEPYATDEEYIRHVHSMIDAYGEGGAGGGGARLVIETNALIDTKYRTWKRNADLINSLLALPKGMNDAGR